MNAVYLSQVEKLVQFLYHTHDSPICSFGYNINQLNTTHDSLRFYIDFETASIMLFSHMLSQYISFSNSYCHLQFLLLM